MCGWSENFESVCHFRIESIRNCPVRFEFESNREASQVPSYNMVHEELDSALLVNNNAAKSYDLNDSRWSKAFIRICVSVCPHDKPKRLKLPITKLATWIVHHESWLSI